jgi:hypothetical protein
LSNERLEILVKRMKKLPAMNVLLFAWVTLAVSACGDESSVNSSSANNASANNTTAKPSAPTAISGSRSPGKPSAPISLDYEVLGKPIVGLPVAINVRVSGSGDSGPISVRYSINDSSSLLFQDGQIEKLDITDSASSDLQQVAVVPQREGRLYVNVSAQVDTPDGVMIKSMAIPIQVGSAPQQPIINGELQQGPDGETVISMPAVENRR